jgi:N-methylhydantoinase B
MKNPLFIHSFEYKRDSAGAGEWRGGLGVELEMEFLNDNNLISAFGDGIDPGSEASGLLGGGKGINNKGELIYPDGRIHTCISKEVVVGIPKGTRWQQTSGGGGGYGDPLQRPLERVEQDVVNGYVSVASARQLYSVVIDPQTMALDRAATSALRRTTSQLASGEENRRHPQMDPTLSPMNCDHNFA